MADAELSLAEWYEKHRRMSFDSDEDGENFKFLNVVSLGNVGAGKSAVLNRLIGHPVLPTGANGATQAPIIIEFECKPTGIEREHVSASILQSKLSKMKKRNEVSFILRTSTAPPLTLIDLPGLDQSIMDNSMISKYAQQNDAILLVIVPASQASEISSSRALKIAKEYDPESARTVGIISKLDQAAENLEAVTALLSSEGPLKWVALTGLSVPIASAQSGSGETSLETESRPEAESFASIFSGTLQSKVGRNALVDTLAGQIRSRMMQRLPNIFPGLNGLTQSEREKLERLHEQLIISDGGTTTSAISLELCRKIEDLLHFTAGGEAPELKEFELVGEGDARVTGIFAEDIVKNRNTEVYGIVSDCKAFFIPLLPISQPRPQLEKEEVNVVERIFFVGDLVRRLREEKPQIGIVVGVKKTVSLASPDGDIDIKVSADHLQRIREYFEDDIVYQGTKLGKVTYVELVTTFLFEDGSKFSVVDPDKSIYKPIFTTYLEDEVCPVFYKGQEILYGSQKGVVDSHGINRIEVKWFGDRSEPPVWVMTGNVRLLLPTSFLVSRWFPGQRCRYHGNELLIRKCERSIVSVLWDTWHEENFNSTELAKVEKGDKDAFFNGDFRVTNAVCRVEEVPLQPYFGMVSGVTEMGIKVVWEDETETIVTAEDIDLAEEFSCDDNPSEDDSSDDDSSDDDPEVDLEPTDDDDDGEVTD